MPATQYSKYRKLKVNLKIKYRGFRIDQLLTIDIWGWANSDSIPEDYEKFYDLAYDFSFLINNTSDYLFFFNVARKDHLDVFRNVASTVSDIYNIIERFEAIEHIEYHSKLNRWYSNYIVKRRLRHFFYSEAKKQMIAARICMLMNSIDIILKQKIHKIKRYVSYSPIHPGENFVGQYYKKKGAQFYGLTHGLVPFYTKNIPLHCVNYDDLDIDCCLVWGEMTKDHYIKHGVRAESIKVAGYIKTEPIRRLHNKHSLKNCMVLLAGNGYEDSNIKLIDILKKFSDQYNFYLKLHPSLSFEKYKYIADKHDFSVIDMDTLLTECLDNQQYEFAIAVNTTSYYESILFGIPCMRFDDEECDLYESTINDAIKDERDFRNVLDFLETSLKDGTYDKQRKKMLQYTLGMNTNKYREILTE